MMRQSDSVMDATIAKDFADNDGDLAALLTLDYFLLKVLSCLVDDGLHECRRVCRQWRNAVSQLPVKLTLHASQWLPPARDAFPAAGAVTCAQEMTSMDMALRSQISCRCHAFDLDSAMLQQIASFRQLEKLVLNCWERDGMHAFEAGIARLTNLKSLELTLTDGECTFQHCSHCLRHLTQLTHLALGLSNRSMHDAQPITELTKLRSLAIHPDMIAKRDGTLLFPCVPQLTRLCIRTMHSKDHTRFPNGLIKVIWNCAPFLRSLKIRPPFADELSNDELSMLSEFKKLEKLTLSGQCVRKDNFFLALQKMQSLTSLDIMPLDFLMPAAQRVFSLTQLRSLRIADMSQRVRVLGVPLLDQLRHLKRLAVIGRNVGSLACLTSLVDLTICDQHILHDCDVSATLRSTMHLTNLRLSGWRITVRSEGLSHLTALRNLSLEGVKVDDQIFPTLANLKLEDLRVRFIDDKVFLYHLVNLVTSLKRLTLASGEYSGDAPYQYLSQGRLKQLRYLTVDKHRLTLDEADDLRGRLPCLRKIMPRLW